MTTSPMRLQLAVRLCRMIHRFCPDYGAHVALTGGCLYKDGERKDCDLVFYRIRQVEEINREGLLRALEKELNFERVKDSGFCWKMKWKSMGKLHSVDFLFPEDNSENSEYVSQPENVFSL